MSTLLTKLAQHTAEPLLVAIIVLCLSTMASGNSYFNQPDGQRPFGPASGAWPPDPAMLMAGKVQPPSAMAAPNGYPPGAHPNATYYPMSPSPGSNERNEFVWNFDLKLLNFFKRTTNNTWIRMEYLLWSYRAPGARPIGSDRELTGPRNRLDGTAGPGASVATMEGFNFRHVNGVRLTWGVPLVSGDEVEHSFFILQRNQESFDSSGQTILTDLDSTTVTNAAAFWDVSYESTVSRQTWGMNTKFVHKVSSLDTGFVFKLVGGIRYLNFDDQLNTTGVASAASPIGARTGVILSHADNHLIGPQLGFRFEFVHEWFTLGVEPLFTPALNIYRAQVDSTNIIDASGTTLTTSTRRVDLSAIFDITAYMRIRLSENAMLYAGYSYLFASHVQHSFDAVNYQHDPSARFTGPVVRKDLEELFLDGLVIGGEFRFK